MKSTMSLQVDTDTLLRLISHLKVRGGAQDVTAALNSAIDLWLREQTKLARGCDPASVRGYQWKSLFLPEGTEIRSWSYGEHNYARVIGDEIIHQGQAVTPNQFAQSFARSMRNAWMDLYVRRPQDQQFHMAHRLRLELARQAKQAATPPDPAPEPTLAAAAPGPTPAPPSAPAPTPAPPPPPHIPDPAATLSDLNIAALLTALQAQTPAPRNIPPGQGWDLPERRKLRFRLEDVAY